MREVKAVLTLLRAEDGGRKTAIANGYRPSFYIGDLQTDGAIQLLGVDQQNPGETMSVRIRLLHPENFGKTLMVGVEFEAREGAKTIGRGRITEL